MTAGKGAGENLGASEREDSDSDVDAQSDAEGWTEAGESMASPRDWELLGLEGEPFDHDDALGQLGSGFRPGRVRGELVCDAWQAEFSNVYANYESWSQWQADFN